MAGFAVVLMGTACNTASKPTVSGQHGGHDYVDLGLPSGNMWATCNIGAGLAEENGLYFAWGETTSKEVYDWSNYRWGNGEAESRIKVNKYCSAKHEGEVDNLLKLDFADDAANKSWGGKWRMPTREDIKELVDNCYWVYYYNYNGTKRTGFVAFKAKTDADKGVVVGRGQLKSSEYTLNDAHIFFRFSGCKYSGSNPGLGNEGTVWSSSINTVISTACYCLFMNDSQVMVSSCERFRGLPVRPVFNN